MQHTSYRSDGRRRKRRTVALSHGRSFGSGKVYGKEKPDGPSRSQEAAEQALRDILDLFDSGDLPARIAQTVIARREGTSPMVNWSLGNQLVCLLAGTTDARGFRQWKEVGRSVSKGSRCIYILAPIKRTFRDTDPDTGDEIKRSIVAGFKGIPVFAIESTEGSPIETPDYAPETYPPLYDVAERFGVTVAWGPFAGRFRGYYQPGEERIMLCSHDERTFLHELAHAAHKRVLAARGETLKGGQHAGQEIVAELCAAVLARLHDLDPGHLAYSADYISSYAKGKNPAAAAMRVLADVQAVLLLMLETADGAATADTAERELAAA